MGWGSLADILNKIFPSRKEAYVDELNSLLVQYEVALKANKDTEAAVLLKRMQVLRKKLGYTEGDV